MWQPRSTTTRPSCTWRPACTSGSSTDHSAREQECTRTPENGTERTTLPERMLPSETSDSIAMPR